MECRWNAVSRADWDALAPDAALQQSWAYGAAMASLGAGVARASFHRDGEIVGVAQCLVQTMGGVLRFATLMRGPVWTARLSAEEEAAAYRALRTSPPWRAPRILLMQPDSEAPTRGLTLARLRRVMTGYGTGEIDLSGDDASLRAAMRGKWRNRLRAAEASGGWIALGARNRLGWLLSKESDQQSARGYRGLPAGFVEAYAKAAGRDALRLYEWRRPGETAADAAMLFLRHGRGATYQIGWAGQAARKAGAHNAILWRAMRELRARGLQRLDLGGIDTESAPGLARFKLGSGARPVQLCGGYC